MDLKNLPPPFCAVVLRDGKVFWALNMQEALAFNDTGAQVLAESSVGPLRISTIILPSVAISNWDKPGQIVGNEIEGMFFETMISLVPGAEVKADDDRESFPDTERHRSVEDAVLYHLTMQKKMEEQFLNKAIWKKIPFRTPEHGEPSATLKELLKDGAP